MAPSMSPPPPAHHAPVPYAPESKKQYASIIPSEQEQEDRLRLETTISNVSHHDMAQVDYVATGDNDAIYNRFSPHRKMMITFVLSFSSFLAPISSTTVLSAVPEVAETYGCDGTIINLSNAMYMLFMGLSPMFYGPVGNIYGRRWVCFLPLANLQNSRIYNTMAKTCRSGCG